MLPQAPLAAFAEFADHMLHSRDIDPVYPVLQRLITDMELRPDEAEWLTVLYLAFYELTSATVAFVAHPNPAKSSILGDDEVLRLPTGIERRGLRGGRTMHEHLQDWLTRFDGNSFIAPALEWFGDDRYRNDSILSTYVGGVKFNGRWACYKACEVFHKVLGMPNAARDAGHEGSTGPRQGLTLFFPEVKGDSPAALNRLDQQTDALMAAVAAYGTTLEVEEVETLLCDFRSLAHGRYYVGHDTDLMLEGILAGPQAVRGMLLDARKALPAEYLGERHDWSARDKAAMRAYVERGAVLHREPPDGRLVEGQAAAA
jgi:hypothetical protein